MALTYGIDIDEVDKLCVSSLYGIGIDWGIQIMCKRGQIMCKRVKSLYDIDIDWGVQIMCKSDTSDFD